MLEYIADKFNLENVKFKDNSLMCSCPFAEWRHEKGRDSRPSFGIRITDRGRIVYKCMACHSRGDLHDLASFLFKKHKDDKYLEALAEIRKNITVDLSTPRSKKPIKTVVLNRQVHESICPPVIDYKEALSYCENRGISADTCNRLNLSYHPEDKRIIFHIYSYKGEYLGCSGRSIEPDNKIKVLTTKTKTIKHTFIGAHKIDLAKPVLLVEGLFMYAKMHEYQLDKKFNILAAMGSTLSAEQRDLLISISCDVYLFFDNDQAGLIGIFGGNGLKGVNKELGKYLNLYYLNYPNNITDPDLLSNQQVADMIEGATYISK